MDSDHAFSDLERKAILDTISLIKKLAAAEALRNASLSFVTTEGGKLGMKQALGFMTSRALTQVGPIAAQVGSSFGVGLAAWAGEVAATKLAQQFGFEDKRFEACAGFAGAVGGAALVGACFGGPVGAAIGAGVGAAGVGMSKFTTALMNTGFGFSGPKDNWVYYETHNAPNMCLGSYCSGDTWYTLTHSKKNPPANSSGDCFSAGQA